MDLYVPNKYCQSIFTIDYDKLKEENIKCLLFDLDNTIASMKMKKPDNRIIEHFKKLLEMGFKFMILTNALKHRVKPFGEILVIYVYYMAFKPLSYKYKKIMNKYNFKAQEIAAIGDQLMTDIKGANKLGIVSILVNPLSEEEHFLTKLNRIRERKVFRYLSRQNLLKRGDYYE